MVGLALDAEGIAPAKYYYERAGVTFPALVDPNYATRFGGVPKTFFVNEQGVVQELQGWRQRVLAGEARQPVSDTLRRQWTAPGLRASPPQMAALVKRWQDQPHNLATVAELASRYLQLELRAEARSVLQPAIEHYDARQIAQEGDRDRGRLLSQVYLQKSRAMTDNRDVQVQAATMAFFLNPSVGFGKQIARIISPEKFDNRADGSFDNRFREATLQRLRQERRAWLRGESTTPSKDLPKGD